MNRKLSLFMLLLVLLEAPAGADYSANLDQLIADLNYNLVDRSIKTVAVTDFCDTAGTRYLVSGMLEQDLSTKLIKRSRFKIIMKNKQEAAMKEIKLGIDGYTDPLTAKRIGQLIQADALLTGTYRRQKNKLIVDMQLIKVETSDALWAGSVVLSVKDFPEGSVPEEEVPQIKTVTVTETQTVYVPVPVGQSEPRVPHTPIDTSRYTDNGMYSRRPEPIYNKDGVMINNRVEQPQNLMQ